MFVYRIVSLLWILPFIFSSYASAANHITVGDITLQSKKRVGRTLYEYTYSATINNSGVDAHGVTAIVSSQTPNTIIVDGSVTYGYVASGSSSASIDTFKIRQDRKFPFDPTQHLNWQFQSNQTTVSSTITSAGGGLSLPNVATAIFPSGSFANDTITTVSTTASPITDNLFNEFASIFRPAGRLQYEVRINTGINPPVSNEIIAEIIVPDEMINAIPAGYDLEVFAQVLSDGGEELIDTFEIFPSIFDSANKIVTVTLPTQVFSNSRNSTGTYEAVIILAPTPGGSTSTLSSSLSAVAATNTTACAAAPIACPLQGGCQVTSPFQPVRTINGVTSPHTGVDYSAAEGTAVFAAQDGIVERAYNSSSYGNTIIIRHNDGAATLYAHLLTMLVSVGDSVMSGVTQIGTSDGDPNTTPSAAGFSTGPHLHLEYVPNGQIIQSKSRIDPDLCFLPALPVIALTASPRFVRSGNTSNVVADISTNEQLTCELLNALSDPADPARFIYHDPSLGTSQSYTRTTKPLRFKQIVTLICHFDNYPSIAIPWVNTIFEVVP